MSAHCLVAGFHVGEIQIAEHVVQPGEAGIAQSVPEVENAAVVAAQEAAAENSIGLTVENRLNDAGNLGRVVLEIGVLDDGNIAGHVADGRMDRGALAHVAFVEDRPDAAILDG